MRKLTFSALMLMLANVIFGGGLLTNSNQSAQFIRMLSRNASLEIDAVYYNPAGLIKLEKGWHFAVNSQTIFEEKTIKSDFPLLNNGLYEGTTKVPVFPSVYGVYKKNKWAFSVGVGPTSGGGAAEFTRGLPAFEIPISQTRTLLSALGVTGYDVDIYFKGSSVYWGIQLGATYEINDKLSVFGGVRYLPAKNVYQGHIKNIQLQVTGMGYVPAPAFLTSAADAMQTFANMPQTLNPYLDAGGSYTLTQLQGAGQITPQQKGGIEAGLKLMGLPQSQIDVMTLNQINGAYVVASPTFQGQANQLSANAAKMEDRVVDTEQSGQSFVPIIGLNYSPNDDWNFAFKYEMKTFLTLDNKPNPENNYDLWRSKVDSDIPGIITAGVGYRGLDWLEAQFSYNMYFDKRVGWGPNINDLAVWGELDESKIRQRTIDNNYIELGLGLQFNISEKFAISTGVLRSQTGVSDSWQNDLSYSISSFTLAGGIMWKITDKLTFDLGISNTFYQDEKVSFDYPSYPDLAGKPITSYSNNYAKTTIDFAAGLSYSIF
jgi:long-subunit fatty acid transport protein